MLEIQIPNNFIEERKYIVQTLLTHYLGLKVEIIVVEGIKDWHILYGDRRLVIQDHFWSKQSDSEYLKESNIPSKVESVFVKEINEDLWSIYGRYELNAFGDQREVGLDLFASAFFMLSRWEEEAIEKRDEYGRFLGEYALAHQQGFLTSPVVDQYVVLLKFLLSDWGITDFKKQEFSMLHTHDVDIPVMWRDLRSLFGRFYFYLKHDRSVLSWFRFDLLSYFKSLLGLEKDPYDTFDYLMDQSERAGIKSHFFFPNYGTNSNDPNYSLEDKRVQRIISNIKARGHSFGLHPGIDTALDSAAFADAKSEVEAALQVNLDAGRQHYLRSLPRTWSLWAESGMEWDSSFGYADEPGFRCGTCQSFHPFDLQNKQRMELVEYPLIAMEQTFITNKKMSPQLMLESIKSLMDRVAHYNGQFVLLWHNSTFKVPEYKPYDKVHQAIIDHYINLKNR